MEFLTGTTKEMHNADFWITQVKDADRILMTTEEIQEFNRRNVEGIRKKGCLYEPAVFDTWLTAEELKDIIALKAIPEGPLYHHGEVIPRNYWQKIYKNIGLDTIEDDITVRYGICTKRSDIRTFPTSDSLNLEPDDPYTDELQSTIMLLNEPVLVLHQSIDAKWYFIRTYFYDGWVHSDTIGLCENYDTWMKVQEMEQFIMVTANDFHLPYDPLRPEVSLKMLSMGIRLELASREEYTAKDGLPKINWRVVVDNYVVKVPVRNRAGMVQYELVELPYSADISIGYLPYTTKNVLQQAFKMLGDLYGWGGAFMTRDCSALTFEVYRCFGFKIPRDAINQGEIISCVSYNQMNEMEPAKKHNALLNLRPGAILGFPGHVMMYIGDCNGQFYTISQTGHFCVMDEEKRLKKIKVDSCLVNSLSVRRKNGLTWYQNITFAKSFV
jgi:hypothetical protein